MLNQIVKVKTRDGTHIEPIQSIVLPSFQYDEQVNTQRQISFVAKNDYSFGYSLIQENNLIEFDGQEYIIQQLDRNFVNGYPTVNVTASHIYTDCHRIMQYKQNEKAQSYSVQDVLNFYFANNRLGFTTKVVGSFSKKKIEGLGGDSAFDGLGKIVSSWPDAVVTQDNKHIVIYQHSERTKHLGKRLSYGHNSDNIQLNTDISSIINSFYVVGGTKEEKVTTGNSKNKKTETKTVPFFPPHIVKDEKSIAKYGEWSGGILNDERFHDAKAMDDYAKGKFVLEPPLTITLDYKGGERPIINELKRLEILETGYVTDIEVVGYSWHPFDDGQVTTVTLNSLRKTSLEYFRAQQRQQSLSKKKSNAIAQEIQNTLNHGLAWDWRGND
ncbi:prophage endopeptidase tail family protein [Weissella minor]|uniref:Minor structural protein n=1 Tax=Weissella minor TaxID=1620 RepID=A0A0R2JTP2_9LACO|nr:prophage endopeptidase tail family protein [Weissella minor]KRN77501.1 minor structural protein [Weissella minor]